MAGLAYEVLWLRLLAAVLGNAAAATSAVLAAVMAGMGLGGLLAGRRADRVDPLRLYGLLELALGAAALAVPTVASLAGELSPHLERAAGPGWAAGPLRFLIASAVVLVPASLMGATVPVLARFVELGSGRAGDRVGPSAGLIYALNAAGAAVGCALAGYVLLGRYGIQATSAMAAAVDVAAGALALVVGLVARRASPSPPARAPEAPGAGAPRLPGPLVLALAALGGACMLALEGLWTRFLLIVFGHDVHAFSSMLAVVLAGLGLGSAAYAALPARLRGSPATIPVLLGLLAAATVATFALAGHAYLGAGLDVFGLVEALAITRTHEQDLLLQPVFAAVVVLGPSLVSGALLPALCAALAGRGAGSRVGHVLAANTAGSIVGSLLPSLVLVPALGLQRAIVAVGAAAAAGCVAALAAAPRLRAGARWLGAALAVLALAFAAAAAPRELPRRVLARKIGANHLRFELYEEGRTGTVAVTRNVINGERVLFINGVNEVTTRLVHDQSFKLLGHLGLLLHRHPRDVLVICLGAGLSAGAAATHDVERLEIVDLERSVAHAARRFGRENNGVLDDPRVGLVFDDGRHHLRTTARRYDVVVVDSTHPRAVDSWILYTREFYRTAAARLAEPGYLVQWLPLHGLSVDEFRIIVHTFVDTFPEASLWVNAGYEPYGQAAYALLVGPRGAAGIDRGVLADRLGREAVRADLEPWGLGSEGEVLECFVAGPEALRRWTGHLPINTDDLPLTQFVTPWTASAPMTAARLLEVRQPVERALAPPLGPGDAALASELRVRGLAQGFLWAGAPERAWEVCGDTCEKLALFLAALGEGPRYFRAIAALYPGDNDRLLEIAEGFRGLGLDEDAAALLDAATRADRSDARLWLNLGVALSGEADQVRARRAFRAALAHSPRLVLGRINLGLLQARSGRVEAALADLRLAVELDPELAEAHAALGFALIQADEPGPAERSLRRALELDPRHREARIDLGRLLLATGRVEEAAGVFRVGRRLYPYDADMLFNLGTALLRAGRDAEAARALEAALRVDPGDDEARALLGLARQALPTGSAAP